jgi:hypothetical protein
LSQGDAFDLICYGNDDNDDTDFVDVGKAKEKVLLSQIEQGFDFQEP